MVGLYQLNLSGCTTRTVILGAWRLTWTGPTQPRERDQMLSAVYNQLGNACFYIHKFHKALEYHKRVRSLLQPRQYPASCSRCEPLQDLEIAERLKDRPGQAKAFGNLGNTFKSLNQYDNAIKCCESHLEITREQKDRLGEGRACYNLGNVHHAVGKQGIATKAADRVKAGKASIHRAIEYYKITLEITTELKDTSGEGRAVGNLGNAYTAIGQYDDAIMYHRRRLAIAEQAKDLNAKARACGNLGNAYSALHDYSEALSSYKMSLAVAKEAKNVPGMSQAYYCIGSTYALLKNYIKAIEFHEQHLALATKMEDKPGMLRAWYNLRNASHALQNNERTVYYHKLIQDHQKQQDSARVVAPATAQDPSRTSSNAERNLGGVAAASATPSTKPAKKTKKELPKAKPTKGPTAVEAFQASDSSDDDDEIVRVRVNEKHGRETSPKKNAAFTWLEQAIAEADGEEASGVISGTYVIQSGELAHQEDENTFDAGAHVSLFFDSSVPRFRHSRALLFAGDNHKTRTGLFRRDARI